MSFGATIPIKTAAGASGGNVNGLLGAAGLIVLSFALACVYGVVFVAPGAGADPYAPKPYPPGYCRCRRVGDTGAVGTIGDVSDPSIKVEIPAVPAVPK